VQSAPITSTTSSIYSSSAGIPLSSGIAQQPILSSGISQAGLAQQPLYSNALPVQQQPLQFMTKQQEFQQQQTLSRPYVGSGAF
jgi:hypothetical protein